MEQEIENLKKRVVDLEKKLAGKEFRTAAMDERVPEPKGLKKQEYEYVEGWKIVDMKIMNEALEIAQKCGHSQIVLVEANRQKMRADLSAHLAYVCITCGKQTVFSTSTYSQEEPPNYVVNKEFATLGKSAFSSLVNIIQEDETILPVPYDKKISDRRPTFLFKFEESSDENSEGETEGDTVNPLEVDLPAEVKCEPDIGIKEEPEDYLEDYLEPSVSLTEEHTDDGDNDDTSHKVKEENDESTEESIGPQIDVSTISTNTPTLAMSTVRANTEVMGGMVTPWPPHLLITVHPSLFIRTTCSKILLPPGLYNYQRNNGLQSIMSVKSDSGTFDSIESHYHMTQMTDEVEKTRGKKVDNIRWNTKVKKTYTSAHRKTPLQIYSQDCKKSLANEGIPKNEWDKHIIDRWARLPAEEKKEFNDRALNPNGKPSEPEETPKEKKKTTNIPLPALKKFAAEVAPGLKKKKPYLAKVENRGQLNKHILERWMLLSVAEQTSYKLLAGMSVDSPVPSPSQRPSQAQPNTAKTGPSQGGQNKPKIKQKDEEDSDEEYQPRPSKRRKPV
eukprot:GFUD01007052.1.p1 GENE.GFUD01007052.1~~GFUD01007052.1.p1  ORF type:complete len:560 (+),score=220.44 GFUD01007052.1:152-1831(+)